MSSLIVEVCKVDKIETHPNADRLSLCRIKGWCCVVPKDVYKEGQLIVYIPTDSILPDELALKLFPPESKIKIDNNRIRAIKLRGYLSEGLVADFEALGIKPQKEGTDLADKLGIEKYEPPVRMQSEKAGDGKKRKRVKNKNNVNFHKYTDIQNLKNFPDIFEEGEEVYISEKTHGSNWRASYCKTKINSLWKIILRFFNKLPEYECCWGSHNMQLQYKIRPKTYYKTNIYEEMLIKYNIKDLLRKGETIYAEVYGESVQKNYMYDCQPGERKMVVFDIKQDGRYLDYDDFVLRVKELGLIPVKELYRGSYNFEKIKELATGDSVFCPSQKVIEGIVIKPVKETIHPKIGRKILKYINGQYLLDKSNTDFH